MSEQNQIAIRVSNLSKCFHIYERPKDRLKQSIYPRLQRSLGKKPGQYFREFWALKDVSFEIKKGETIGIIGRNGSGKSTLLQLVCGTLSPTFGEVEIHGRVAALLELGAGFNPEFTGRENIYMNASVLGLSQDEIDARFDSIVAFADIGDFIEQPVKTYSSGMYVRLAFAVIAHVDADILVIDEALSVGDAVFTQKCMRFLRTFIEKGTVLFVSHDTSAIINLCKSAAWLAHGKVRMISDAKSVSEAYVQYCSQEMYGDTVRIASLKASPERSAVKKSGEAEQVDPHTKIDFFDNVAHSEGWKSGALEIESVSLTNQAGQPIPVFLGGESVTLSVRAVAHQAIASPIIGFLVKDRLGQSLFGEHTYTYMQTPLAMSAGDNAEARFEFTLPWLPNGDYSMTVSIADGDPEENIQHHLLHDAALIHVSSTKLRYGLVGIPFKNVQLKLVTG